MAMSDAGLGLAIISIFFAQFFWFFGVHGANVMAAIFDPIFFMVTAINIALYSTLGIEAAIATGEMGYWGANWSKWFIDIGGSGGTLSLIAATFIFSRRREYKELSKYATPPGLFGINEPVIFGWPLVLNGIYAVPFILGPLLSIFPYYIFGPVLKVINPPVIILPWTTPSILGAVLANLDWKSIIPFFICFGIQFALWVPFIFIDNKNHFKKLKLSNPEKYELEMKYLKDKDYRMSVKAEIKAKNLARKEKAKARKLAAAKKKDD
ncbi:PTS transporter subunit EIIC [Spiroplasma clarkii]|nr:PTS transporter subunit EIIC [Spiroplasma clarkii]